MAKTLHGTVVSDLMDKTVVVAVATVKEHPIYRKKYKVTQKFNAHDATNEYKIGDLVEITESRPLSKTKRWKVIRRISVTEVEA
ncbi:MAG: 30S ribosomal protein S17 [Candidatus Saccharimonadia bacterium]